MASRLIQASRKSWMALGAVAAGALTGGMMLPTELLANDVLAPPNYPWEHKRYLSAFDHKSMRRGFQVYRQVCAACHSLEQIAYRNLVDTVMTEEEVKELALSTMITDGPNDEGKMFERPGKLSDYIPSPYPNEEAARHANGGAYPPDMSLIANARNNGENYIFSLLMGYLEDPPAGVKLGETQHYNVYFPGQAIGMQAPLYDEIIEYEDGTPATKSQLAKDVVVFLKWCAEPEFDDRKRMGLKVITMLLVAIGACSYWKRFKWSVIKNRQVQYVPRNE